MPNPNDLGFAPPGLPTLDDRRRREELRTLLDRYLHRVRNRMNSLKLSLYLARRTDGGAMADAIDWDRANEAYRRMEQLVEQLQVATARRP